MMVHIAALGALVLVFLLATVRPINMGLLAFGAVFLVGLGVASVTPKQILEAFPGDLFVTLVGVTFLFAVAQRNGAIEWLVELLERLTGNRAVFAPWIVFVFGAALTGFGALGPAAVAIVSPIALRYADHHRISPLMMGLMAIHGAQAGSFSPVSVYGGIVDSVVVGAGLPTDPTFLFLATGLFNAAIALAIFAFLGGRRLLGDRGKPPAQQPVVNAEADGMRQERALTLFVLAGAAIAAIGFRVDIGAASMIGAACLAIVAPKSQKAATDRIAWSTVLLICGVVTYVGLLQRIGTISLAADTIALIGTPVLGGLLLCYLGGIVSAFASSTALLGIIVPLAAPFLQGTGISATGMIAAIAISTTIVDTSPFSTNGALVVANASTDQQAGLFRQLLIYTAILVLCGPLLAWLILII
ncbi:MAG: hypothetical protein EOP60_00090 [Sphingomonadales bacterium]|nr:MAG: hypothetical protein EOP60_00090 [Sphingomonadales bacterium]